MKLDKPFKTYEEQVEILEKKWLLDIGSKKNCIKLLKTISYYDLINEYDDIFIENEKFKYGVSETSIFKFMIFDKDFQHILFKYSIYAENSFKSKLAYIVAKNIGVHQNRYLDSKRYQKFKKDKRREKRKNQIFNKIRQVAITSINSPTYFYRKNYNHIPPWILFKNITFNHVIRIYSYLKIESKKEMSDNFYFLNVLDAKAKEEFLINSTTIIRKFRNKIAHNYKLLGFSVTDFKLPAYLLEKIFPKTIFSKEDSENNIGKNDLFAMILSLCILLDNKTLILLMLNEIISLISSSEEISNLYIKSFNLPVNFKERLESLLKFFEE